MITKYIKTNNLCYDDSNGSIRITEIKFKNTYERTNFRSYTIEWSTNINPSQISSDKLRVSNLKNGTYSYKLKSLINNAYSQITTIKISSPPKLKLEELQKSEYSCDNNGYYKGKIIGGKAPYFCTIGDQTITIGDDLITPTPTPTSTLTPTPTPSPTPSPTSTATPTPTPTPTPTLIEDSTGIIFEINNLRPGTYQTRILDSNNCLAIGDSFIIKDDKIELLYNNIYPPTIYDGYGYVNFDLVGFGPFDLEFFNITTAENITYTKFNNPYLTDILDENNRNVQLINNQTALGENTLLEYNYENILPENSVNRKRYKYIFDNLSPGDYQITVNPAPIDNRCSIISYFSIPNISPISVTPKITPDNPAVPTSSPILTRDIYDTILIPFRQINSNSELWQLVESLSINKSIYLDINEIRHEFVVVRNMLDKYYLSSDRNIEILKLGNFVDKWFYYFHVSPGLETFNLELFASNQLSVSIYDPINKKSYPITLGLTSLNEIDNYNASLIRGSFIIGGTGYNEFNNGVSIKVSVGDQPDDNDLLITDISTSIVKNIYSPLAYDTTINFLEKYNTLTYNINLENITINSLSEDSLVQKNIISLLKMINNTSNYNNIYVYTESEPQHNGSLDLDISGQNTFFTPNGSIDNSFSIKYYTFNNTDIELKSIYINNILIENTEFLAGLKEQYILIRIKDIFDNIPKYINFNDTLILYDNHYIEILQILNSYSISNKIQYGDILIYIGNLYNTLNIPHYISDPIPETTNNEISIIEPTGLSLSVKIGPQNTKCIIYGPKNYYNTFDKDTTFSNLLPGVYIIKGDEDYLNSHLLYQNETRVILDNTNELVNLIFTEYKNKTSFI